MIDTVAVLHGTWIPDETLDFIQGGRFYLWAEGVAERGTGSRPRTLTGGELARLLAAELPGKLDAAALQGQMIDCHLLLPQVEGRLLPSPQLARRADLPEPTFDQPLELQPVGAAGWPVPGVLTVLKDLHYLGEQGLTELILGEDLRFWHRVSRVLAGVIRGERFIPALVCRTLPPKGRGAGSKPKQPSALGFHPSWEIVSDDYETAVRDLARRMPLLCGAGHLRVPETLDLYEPESLMRHCCESLLLDHIEAVRWPESFNRKVYDTLLQDVLSPRRHPEPFRDTRSLERYRQWRRWRQALVPREGEAFQLGFMLCEPEEQEGPWWLDFLAVSRRDPSLQLALEDYWDDPDGRRLARRQFGDDFERQLLLALGQAARMVPRLWAGLDSPHPSGLELSLEEVFDFLKEQAWLLEEAGFKVLVPAWWTPQGRRRARLKLRASASGGGAEQAPPSGHFSAKSLISYRYELSIGDEPVSPEEWRQLVAAKTPLVQFRGQWLELDRAEMARMLAFWEQQGREEAKMPLGELLGKMAEEDDEIEVDHDQALAALIGQLHDPARLAPADDPLGLQGSLRHYQRRGLAWLAFLEGLGLNGCLADDMGLGKTIQVLARLLQPGARQGPTLLIAPTSVMGNWQREAARFAPDLKVTVHHGQNRLSEPRAFRQSYEAQDLVITSFALARLDAKLFARVPWWRVVVDEAQNIKNPKAAQTRAILKLETHHRLALTGTPVENRLLDLWSIFQFLNPGYLGSQAQFRRRFEKPVQRDDDRSQARMLRRLVQPFILRRLKSDRTIIQELPDKLENRQYCHLTREQSSLYQAVVDEVEREIEQSEGMARRGLILATLMRLKQICNHPAQFLADASPFEARRSHKLERLLAMTEEVIEEGESLLVFTQFTEVGDALERLFRPRVRTFWLHGATPQARRERMIAAFQDPEGLPAVFILSLKAGGTGITLTRANHVFHFDRWWNPAVEEQATDRAYRIGQQKTVMVHKFVTLGTVEERIDRMIEDKKALAGGVVGSDEGWLTELSNDHFKKLIRLSREALAD
ncbi:MAG: DEAD/DEAH box helicase [Candidatus Competibacteraceae bacterium]|nr:DEAD/DEAH box helicase [Candidatus Competibacteraceae bacterium]